jgi:hypothetical protein
MKGFWLDLIPETAPYGIGEGKLHSAIKNAFK